MNLLDSLQQKVGFTRREAMALLLLSGTFLAGTGIQWFRSNYMQTHSALPAFDYSKSDSAYLYHTQRDSSNAPPRPSVSSSAQNKPKKSSPSKHAQPVNINTASKEQLVTLPGIGPAMAERIIAYRKTAGQLTSVDQLTNVKGIGKKTLDKLRPYVCVR